MIHLGSRGSGCQRAADTCATLGASLLPRDRLYDEDVLGAIIEVAHQHMYLRLSARHPNHGPHRRRSISIGPNMISTGNLDRPARSKVKVGTHGACLAFFISWLAADSRGQSQAALTLSLRVTTDAEGNRAERCDGRPQGKAAKIGSCAPPYPLIAKSRSWQARTFFHLR
jgi:hypothetical protein